MFSGPQLSRLEVAEGIVVSEYHTFVPQQIFPEFLSHGPLEGKKFQLH
jgi:hypothetical protein